MTVGAFQKTLADNIRGFRFKCNYSQEKLAILAHVSEEIVSLIERKKANPSITVIYKISQALKVEPHQLFTPNEYKKGEEGTK